MKARSCCPLLLLLSSALAAPAVLAVDAHPADAAPAAGGAQTGAVENAPPTITASASMHVLRERMRELRRTTDPARRMQLMEAQMNQLDDVIRGLDGVCPTPDIAPGMMGMVNGRESTMSNDEMLAKRMEMMEKRMDMMQMMLQRQNATAAGADADARR